MTQQFGLLIRASVACHDGGMAHLFVVSDVHGHLSDLVHGLRDAGLVDERPDAVQERALAGTHGGDVAHPGERLGYEGTLT